MKLKPPQLGLARFDLPLSVQIVGLMLAGLVVAQAVTLFLTLLAPPAPAPEYSLHDVAAALQGEMTPTHGARPLVRTIRADPPSLASGGWLVSEQSRRELAGLLHTDEANVRLLFYTPLPFAGATAGARAAVGPLVLPHRAGWSRALAEADTTDGLRQAAYGGPGGGFGGGPGGGAPGSFGGPGAGQGQGQGQAAGGGPGVGGRAPGGRGPNGAGPGGGSGAAPGSGGGAWRSGALGAPSADDGGGIGILGPNPSSGRASPGGAQPSGGATSTTRGDGVLQGGGVAGPGAYGPGAFGPGAYVQAPGAFGPGAAGQAGPGAQGPLGAGSVLPGQAGQTGQAQSRADAGYPDIPPQPTLAEINARPAAETARPEPSPRPAALAPGAPSAADLGVIAPAPLVAAQNGDDAGWIVGTPQQTARGLFGLSPSPFVQGDFVAAVRTAPRQWATVAPKPEPFPNAWQRRVLWWFAAAFAVVGPLGYLFARRLARPIDQFAAAAERIGRDPSAPLAPLSGPAEIGRAAKAFNQMHNRLRRFVEDRTGMVGAISHDLRTPLARMRFRLERVPADVRVGMLHDIQQMEEMISSVLVFIRDAAEPSVRERIDLRSLVECVVDDAALLGGEAVLDPGEPVSVEVDALGVQRVLTNLVDNALKYGDRAEVRLYVEGGEAVAEVADDGPGLSPDEIERVFLPFYRGDEARGMNKGGIGLGLAVSRSIARAHGGDVRLASNGQGLKAQLRLPIADKLAWPLAAE